MRVGDVVSTRNVKAVVSNGWLNFKAPNGEVFVFLLLGAESTKDDAKKLDCVAALKQLGWKPATSRDLVIDQQLIDLEQSIVECRTLTDFVTVQKTVLAMRLAQPWEI